MKTKLTLNVDDKIVARAKRVSAKKNVSLSSLVEGYLDRLSKSLPNERDKNEGETITDRIRKFTSPIDISDAELEKMRDEYLESKYGK
jgi:hypothetical protein